MVNRYCLPIRPIYEDCERRGSFFIFLTVNDDCHCYSIQFLFDLSSILLSLSRIFVLFPVYIQGAGNIIETLRNRETEFVCVGYFERISVGNTEGFSACLLPVVLVSVN
jgi:hypothetical protein